MTYPINTHLKAAIRGVAALALTLTASAAMAGVIKPPPGPGLPVHELIQELEGDYSGLVEQEDPRFGFSVAMYGDTLVVGAPGTRVGGTSERGAVFVFRRSGGQWQLTQRLLPASGTGEPQCGYSVAVDAFNVLIGCPYLMVDGEERGRARLYTRGSPSADFQLSEDFDDSGDVSGSLCGRSVSLLGAAESESLPLAAVSCPGRGFDQGGGILSRPGEVDIYRWLLGWAHAATVSPGGTPPFPYTNYGNSIHLHQHAGDIMLAVGRPETTNGQALIYQMGAVVTDWTLDHTYNGTNNGQFGYSVHLRGDRLVAGAPTRTRLVPTQGGNILIPVGSFSIALRSCVFNPKPDPPDCEWGNEPTEILGNPAVPSPIAQNRLGHAVHVLASGGLARVIAGEPAWPITNSNGRARHYHRDGADWELNDGEPFYQPSMPPPSALGSSLAGDGNWLAVGAPGYPVQDEGLRGRVFLYAYNNDMFSDRFEQ